MKIEKLDRPEKTFVPVEIVFTIENAKELDDLMTVCRLADRENIKTLRNLKEIIVIEKQIQLQR